MTDSSQIRLGGYGGQGIILAGMIFGYAAINGWEHVAGLSSYGSRSRGGACSYDIVISKRAITFPRVIKADILVAMSQDAYNTYIGDVKEGGIVFYDEQVTAKEIEGMKQMRITATSTAAQELNNGMVANMVMLGIITQATKLISKASLVAAVRANIPERFRELNLRAINIGFKRGEQIALRSV